MGEGVRVGTAAAKNPSWGQRTAMHPKKGRRRAMQLRGVLQTSTQLERGKLRTVVHSRQGKLRTPWHAPVRGAADSRAPREGSADSRAAGKGSADIRAMAKADANGRVPAGGLNADSRVQIGGAPDGGVPKGGAEGGGAPAREVADGGSPVEGSPDLRAPMGGAAYGGDLGEGSADRRARMEGAADGRASAPRGAAEDHARAEELAGSPFAPVSGSAGLPFEERATGSEGRTFVGIKTWRSGNVPEWALNYTMGRDYKSVSQYWQEWAHGKPGCPLPLRKMEELYGCAWRKGRGNEIRYFSKFRKLCVIIEDVMKRGDFAEAAAIKAVEASMAAAGVHPEQPWKYIEKLAEARGSKKKEREGNNADTSHTSKRAKAS